MKEIFFKFETKFGSKTVKRKSIQRNRRNVNIKRGKMCDKIIHYTSINGLLVTQDVNFISFYWNFLYLQFFISSCSSVTNQLSLKKCHSERICVVWNIVRIAQMEERSQLMTIKTKVSGLEYRPRCICAEREILLLL